ncbi:NAD-dependent epimerase/dehydratase family protein [Fibrella forsythiae]|uniref:NAD-dependent epimerase/dehydratase family protein n=1 Tax=Fibrella forsythiae TaxID=2817061 RepID=A0ABS3JI12_9BACT|nr:NAD-dependent epimerase/dehydratase family protein [Fibrella forsythiae]MBO0949610.1 NAD-dependent epimerase/dehydratase family protein [Fibrella forsythiae]
MSNTILLTGANGFLGSHIARELLARRYVVRALVRRGSSRSTLAGLPIDFIEGDICRQNDLLRAADGCAGVIHAAALAQVNPARNVAVWEVNKTGTEHVLQAVKQHGIRRLVYVGTANVFGFGTREQPGDEQQPYSGQRYGVDYMDSKVAATESVKLAVHRDNVPAIMVHPSFLVGPLDSKPTSGAMLLAVARRQLPGYTMGGKNFIHVRDAAIGTVNALTMGSIGESYILGNENLTYRQAFTLMAQVAGVQPPRLSLSPGLTRLYGQFNDWLATLTGKHAQVTLPMALIANDGHYFSSQKAINELNLPQTPIREALQEAYDWFTAHGYVY